MAEWSKDPRDIAKVAMDIPFRAPGGRTAEEAACKPGNAVKSNERQANGFPKHFGILVEYGSTCVVCDPPGRTLGSEPFVWRGRNDEYHRTWQVD